MRIPLPSNNITKYNTQGNVYQPGSIPWESRRQQVLWDRISGKPRQAFRQVFPKTDHRTQRSEYAASVKKLRTENRELRTRTESQKA
jgi:hypothetical protein